MTFRPFYTENHVALELQVFRSKLHDNDFADLLPVYVDVLAERVQQLAASIASGDGEAISRTGHSLKGSAGMYGFPLTQKIGVFLNTFKTSQAHPGELQDAFATLQALSASMRSLLDETVAPR